MQVFLYQEDGRIQQVEMDVDLEPGNPGRSYAVGPQGLIDTDRKHLRQWAINCETRKLESQKRWLEDTKRTVEATEARIASLREA